MATVVTKTIKPGGGGDYTTLAAWATARLGADLVDTIERAECYGGNCGGVTIPAATTTDATSRVEVVAADGFAARGIYDESRACCGYINAGGTSGVVRLLVRDVSASGSSYAVRGSYYAHVACERVFGRQTSFSSTNAAFADCAVCTNCIASAVAAGYRCNDPSGGAMSAECCTAIGSGTGPGFSRTNGVFVAKNCIAQNCTDGFSGTFSGTSDYNVSDITGDAPGTHSKTGTVAFVDAANKDFHLAAADTVARGAGVNLTASGITTDIDGETRPATGAWDIGADQYVAPAPTGPWGTPKFGISYPFGAQKFGVTPWM